ncbi:MAG: hypothetical protein FWD57_14330, partial [Polyangiaceae bacterium]|nr:hypothetical protein [Polyangiaceae bacterium]
RPFGSFIWFVDKFVEGPLRENAGVVGVQVNEVWKLVFALLVRYAMGEHREEQVGRDHQYGEKPEAAPEDIAQHLGWRLFYEFR